MTRKCNMSECDEAATWNLNLGNVGAAKAAEQAVKFAEQAAITASGAVDMAYDPPMKPKTKKESAWAEEGDKHD